MTDGMDLPEAARCVLSLLEDAGHSCYVVGACVRDWLLHRSPSDIELVTDVGPEELHRVLEPVGAKVFDVGVSQEAVAVVVAGSPIAVVVGHGAFFLFVSHCRFYHFSANRFSHIFSSVRKCRSFCRRLALSQLPQL